MKRFLVTVLIWTVGLAVFTFFLSNFFFDGQPYRAAVLAAIVFAVITHNFEQQSDRVKSLEERVDAIEKEHTPPEETK